MSLENRSVKARSLENVLGSPKLGPISGNAYLFRIFPQNNVKESSTFQFSDHGLLMDSLREEGGCQRDEKSAGAHAHHPEDLLGEHKDVPQSWVTGKNFKESVDSETPVNDPKGTLCGTEFSTNCGGELRVKEINLLGVHMPTEEQESTLKQEEKGPDKEVEVGVMLTFNNTVLFQGCNVFQFTTMSFNGDVSKIRGKKFLTKMRRFCLSPLMMSLMLVALLAQVKTM